MAYIRDPDSNLDFGVDWSRWLGNGETITAQTVVSDDASLIVSNVTQAAGVVEFWLTGGTVGSAARCTCHITTSGGRSDDRTLTIKTVER